jgi:hypothetical protein
VFGDFIPWRSSGTISSPIETALNSSTSRNVGSRPASTRAVYSGRSFSALTIMAADWRVSGPSPEDSSPGSEASTRSSRSCSPAPPRADGEASSVQSVMFCSASWLGWNSSASPMARRHSAKVDVSCLSRTTLKRKDSASVEPIFPMARITAPRTVSSSTRGARAETAR